MNHFMLPSHNGSAPGWAGESIVSNSNRYGNFAMENLLNELLKSGAYKNNLEIKVFGGGRILRSLTDVGARNTEFVRQYLKLEGLEIEGSDTGETWARRILYYPESGRVRVKRIPTGATAVINDRENEYMRSIEKAPIGGEVDLF